MKIVFMLLTLWMLILLPVASADVIMPGYRGIEINNYISNINDFPDHTFISAMSLEGMGMGLRMCPIHIIGNDGKIEDYYKFCDVSVYAIEKSKFNEGLIMGLNETELIKYLGSSDAKEVIKGLDFYKEVPVTSSEKAINNRYTVDLTKTKSEVDDKNVERNYSSYLYILIGVLIIIRILVLFVLMKKKRRF